MDSGNAAKMIDGWVALVDRYPEEWKLQLRLENAFTYIETLRQQQLNENHEKTDTTLDERQEITTWKELVSKNPRSWGLQVHLAKAFDKNGDIDEEIQGWRDLVIMHPEEWKLQVELAQAFAKKASGNDVDKEVGKIEDEINVWRDLVDRHAESWELQIRLAEAYARKAKLAEVIASIRRRTTAGNLLQRFFNYKVETIRTRNQDIEDWEGLVERHPESRGLQMQLEMAYSKRKVLDGTGGTIAGWKKLLDQHPQQRELAIHMKTAYEKLGRKQTRTMRDIAREAIEVWRELVKKHPKEWTLQTHLSEAYSELKRNHGDPSDEIAGWVDLLNRHPDEQDLRDRLLYACLQCGDIEMANKELKRLNGKNPKNLELATVLHHLFPNAQQPQSAQ
jgi:predicted Zn-dependent protease